MTAPEQIETFPVVLIIDPDEATRTLVRAAIQEDLGGTAIEARDALSGLELARQHRNRLSLVILDIHLPDMDGYDVCMRLRALATPLGNRFAILPFTTPGVMEMLLDELGCERPCFKPATHDQLVLALHRSLPRSSPFTRSAALGSSRRSDSGRGFSLPAGPTLPGPRALGTTPTCTTSPDHRPQRPVRSHPLSGARCAHVPRLL
jgi:CheY-like chemotaxis protein